jgi:peroxiredoxin
VTFLIDKEGTIRKVYEVTDVKTHPDQVLSDIQSS